MFKFLRKKNKNKLSGEPESPKDTISTIKASESTKRHSTVVDSRSRRISTERKVHRRDSVRKSSNFIQKLNQNSISTDDEDARRLLELQREALEESKKKEEKSIHHEDHHEKISDRLAHLSKNKAIHEPPVDEPKTIEKEHSESTLSEVLTNDDQKENDEIDQNDGKKELNIEEGIEKKEKISETPSKEDQTQKVYSEVAVPKEESLQEEITKEEPITEKTPKEPVKVEEIPKDTKEDMREKIRKRLEEERKKQLGDILKKQEEEQRQKEEQERKEAEERKRVLELKMKQIEEERIKAEEEAKRLTEEEERRKEEQRLKEEEAKRLAEEEAKRIAEEEERRKEEERMQAEEEAKRLVEEEERLKKEEQRKKEEEKRKAEEEAKRIAEEREENRREEERIRKEFQAKLKAEEEKAKLEAKLKAKRLEEEEEERKKEEERIKAELEAEKQRNKVDMNRINLGDVNYTADCLKEDLDETFVELDFSKKELISDDVILLAESLMDNKTLTSLDLRANAFDTECIPALSSLIKKNTSLMILELDKNFIPETEVTNLVDALELNKSLTKLSVGNLATEEDMDYIEEILLENMDMAKKSGKL